MDLKSKPFYLNDSDIKWVETTLADMTEEEKIAQLFCLITYTDDENYLKYLSGGLKVGGVHYEPFRNSKYRNTASKQRKNSYAYFGKPGGRAEPSVLRGNARRLSDGNSRYGR